MTTKIDESVFSQHDHVLTAQEVSQRLKLSISTVYFYAETRQLPAVRIGKHWRFPSEKIDALLNRNSNPGGHR